MANSALSGIQNPLESIVVGMICQHDDVPGNEIPLLGDDVSQRTKGLRKPGWWSCSFRFWREINVYEDCAWICSRLAKSISNQVSDTHAQALKGDWLPAHRKDSSTMSALRLDINGLASWPVRGRKLVVPHSGVPFIFVLDLIIGSDACCRHEKFVPGPLELVPVLESLHQPELEQVMILQHV
jgi:hypothetical protein